MTVSYVKADPSGNITLLVTTPVAPEQRQYIAARLMKAEPDSEQLGFLSPCAGAGLRLDMAGGEFCGNATLSAAAFYLGGAGTVKLSVSGTAEPIRVDMEESGGCYTGSLNMPRVLSISGGEYPVVEFPGISHVIMPGDIAREVAEAMIKPLCARLGAEAVGLMLFDEEKMELRPLVYVPGADSLFWERSCASGSCAVAAWLREKRGGDLAIELRQPGGRLHITAKTDGSLVLRGGVRLHEAKTLEIV